MPVKFSLSIKAPLYPPRSPYNLFDDELEVCVCVCVCVCVYMCVPVYMYARVPFVVDVVS